MRLAYDHTEVVHDLTLEVPDGQITAIIGANASGKSTLLRALARLMRPASGVVYLDGEDIHHQPTRQVAHRVAILPQSPSAPDGLLVEDLVARGRYPHQGWLRQWSRADEAAVDQALRATNMIEHAARPVDTLSGGQRQRAWIAMALAQQSDILLLDEPTTFLDLAHQCEVLDLLAELNATTGATIVLVLHDLNQACRYAHHLVALKHGVIHSAGPPEQVVTSDMVRDVLGIGCVIIADPITGTPLCVPARRSARLGACSTTSEGVISDTATVTGSATRGDPPQ